MNDLADSKKLYDTSLVWDMTIPWGPSYAEDAVLHRFHAAGIGLMSLTVAGDGSAGAAALYQTISSLNAFCRQHPESFTVIETADDVVRAHAAGKTALTFNVQGCNVLGGEIGMVEVLYRLGVRHMLLAYNRRNLAGDGCSERTDCGLSRWGIKMIEEMNRVGMLVDGTHCGHKTSMEAIEFSTAPVIFSHSNAYAVYPHYRNIKDDQIKACAKSGGVIGVNGLGGFVFDAEARSEAVFKHIDYFANLVGAQHVGIGSDFLRDTDKFWRWVDAHPETWPPLNGRALEHTKFMQPEQHAELCDLMVKHGYSEPDICGVLGENFLRVARQVWK